MIPQNVLSTEVIDSPFQPPKNRRKQRLNDYEEGGIALNDASQGLQAKTWFGEYIGNQIILSAEDVTPVAVLTKPGLLDFSFTFDQNMRVAIAYEFEDHVTPAEFYWFDNTVGNYVTLVLAAGTISPRCFLDDKRFTQSSVSDIILTYIRNDVLYFRMQRDRYLIEYTLHPDCKGFKLGQFGMNNRWRLQWQLV